MIQQYDFRQIFVSIDAKEACGDLYDFGIDDDLLTLIIEANK